MAEGMKGKNTNAMELTGLLRNVTEGVIFLQHQLKLTFHVSALTILLIGKSKHLKPLLVRRQ